MNANDLASLLSGANVTINLHAGSGDINSQSGHRFTQNNAAPREAIEAKRFEWTYRCELCGYTSHERKEFISHGGYGHHTYNCLPCDQELIDLARDEWQRIRQGAIEVDETPAQIAAPAETAPELIVIQRTGQDYINKILAPRPDLWRELQANAAAHAEAEHQRIIRR